GGLDPEGGCVPRGAEVDRPAFPVDLAVVRGVDPGDRLDENRFARPVVPRQGGHLAGRQIEVHVGEGLDGAEALADPAQGQQRLVGTGGARFSRLPGRTWSYFG